nr:leucine-rich repeat domain-containing protein [Clostridia bacterium]
MRYNDTIHISREDIILKRFLIFLAFTLSLLALVSCGDKACQHRDADDNSLCDKCGESYTDGKDIENCQHIYLSTVTDPTCEEVGTKTFSCSLCEYSYTEIIAALGHDYIDHEAQEGTCTSIGWEAYQTCSRCDYSTYEEIAAPGHNYIDHEAKEATCFEKGWEAYQTCSRCDYNSYVELPVRHKIENGYCTECKLPESTPGLKYSKNADGTYTVTGIGDCQETSISIGIYNGSIVTSIGWSAFYGCSSLTSITIPDSVTSIGGYAFCDCTSLTSVTIPDSVTSIGDLAFNGCSSLTSVTIGNSVTSIGEDAFFWCYKLVEVINKSSLNITKGNFEYGYIGDYALYVHNGESKIVTVGDYLFITYENVNYLLGYTGTATDITLPESYNGDTYKIYKDAFYNCDSLTSVTIPNSVTSIGDWAFAYCDSLTSVTIPDSVTSIGYLAFLECRSLTSVTIPNSVTSIGYLAFYGCDSLASVTFENPDGWWYTEDSSATSGTSISGLSNTSTAAKYLTSTYYKYYWRRG